MVIWSFEISDSRIIFTEESPVTNHQISRFTLVSERTRYKNDAMGQPDYDFIALMKDLTSGEKLLDQVPDPIVETITARLQLGRAEFQKILDDRLESDRIAPGVGARAPDFNLALVDENGVRTGQLRRLSDHRDKPTALIFGSYT